jgi:uncharacterized protein (TIGR03067 family)
MIRNDRWQSQSDPRNGSRGKIDPAKKPAEIDFMHPGGTISPGIYRFVDKDTLEICNGLSGERPKEFTAPEGSNRLHMILKRDASSIDPKQMTNDADRLKGTWGTNHYDVKLLDGSGESAQGALAAVIKLASQPDGMQRIRLTITDDQMILEGSDAADHYILNTAKNPAEIDFVYPDGTKALGIYRFHDNSTLELCFTLRGERPTSLPPPAGTNYAYFTFKRNP